MPPKAPIYNLSELRAVSQDPENIVFHGRRAHLGSMELDYALDDVARCIASLVPSDFHKTLEYEDGDPPTKFDVYKPTFKLNDEHTDQLYIKLALSECGQIVIGSFKPL